MEGTLNPTVKICCISSIEEASLAIECGASAIGLVSKMPSGPGIIDDTLIKQIAESIPSEVSTFLLTSKTSVEEIIEQHKMFNTDTIQIVDKIKEENYAELREKLPKVKIVQVIHIINEESISEAVQVSKFVDAILLDSGNPNLKTKVLGGTGKVHNWNISRTIRDEVPTPVYLAGGLNNKNIKEAIECVQPFGVDLCSGVRTNGALDRNKLLRFFKAIHA